MRLFVAIELSSEIKDYLKELQDELRKADAKISFVRDFHLTLKFLGEVGNSSKVISALEKVRFKAFDFHVSQIGFFPDAKRPRVVWVGAEPKQPIMELQQQIDKVLAEEGFEKDSKFHPHITLGRVKFVKDRDAFANFKGKKFKELSMKTEQFHLIKSELSSEGALHTIISSYQLE
jgi:RNA 2',3'-cyclic 3'-phosphodiesterase